MNTNEREWLFFFVNLVSIGGKKKFKHKDFKEDPTDYCLLPIR